MPPPPQEVHQWIPRQHQSAFLCGISCSQLIFRLVQKQSWRTGLVWPAATTAPVHGDSSSLRDHRLCPATRPVLSPAFRREEDGESRKPGPSSGDQAREFVKEGSVPETLSDLIDRLEIDLVVLGTHGRSGMKKIVLGSVAEGIINSAPCPVFTVGLQVPRMAHHLLPAYTATPGAYALVGMGTAFAGIVRAPMTSVLMILETTRDYTVISICSTAPEERLLLLYGWLNRITPA